MIRSALAAHSLGTSWPILGVALRQKIATTRDRASSAAPMKFIDIGANLTDESYQGVYYGKQHHPPDLDVVIQRAWDSGLDKIIVTAGEAEMSKSALGLALTHENVFSTVGVHPTRCNVFDEYSQGPDDYMESLLEIAQEGKSKGKVVAIGECGLDYDRLQFCDAETQRKYFALQFGLSSKTHLPMFLHMRAACTDFCKILRQNLDSFHGGVVHSFTGTPEEAEELLSFENVYIGINGCSLKSEENLSALEVIPTHRLMIETDSPYCEIRNSHVSKQHVKTSFQAKDKKKYDNQCLVKGRNEPCTIRQVLEVVGAVNGIGDLESLSDQIWQNTVDLFFPSHLS